MRAAAEIRYQILAIQREGNRRATQALKIAGITPSQAEVLGLLRDFGTMSLKNLGELLVCESGDSPSRLIERLVKKGLVMKTRASSDRRGISIYLSTEGLAIAESLVLAVDESLENFVTNTLTETEIIESLKILRKLSHGLNANDGIKKRFSLEFN